MHLRDHNGTILTTLDGNAIPTIDDKNDIIRSVARTDDEFIALCRESTTWPECSNAEFVERCRAWAATQP